MNTKYSAAALLAAVFFAGIAATLGVLRVVEHGQEPAASAFQRPFRGGPGIRGPGGGGPRGPGFGIPEFARMEFTERLAQRLELSDDQRVYIESVMEQRQQLAAEAMESVLPRLKSQMDSLQLEIEGVLTPEQAQIFREFSARGQDRFLRGGRRRPRPSTPN